MARDRESKATIKIPRPLYRQLQQIIEGSDFNSVADFVAFVLGNLVSERELGMPDPGAGTLTARELEKVRTRLKGLRYLKLAA